MMGISGLLTQTVIDGGAYADFPYDRFAPM